MRIAVLAFTVLAATGAAAADDPGAALFKKRMCTACHGADGSGNTPAGKTLGAHDLRSEAVQKRTDGELEATITNGQGKMPSFKSSLSPAEVRQIVAYVRTLAKKTG